MTELDRFLAVMSHEPADRVPNWEVGAWPQTFERWRQEGADFADIGKRWWHGAASLGIDGRIGFSPNCSLLPPFEEKLIEEDAETEVFQDGLGRVRRALKPGTIGGSRTSMDTYISFAVHDMASWQAMKKRLVASDPARYPPGWREKLAGLQQHDRPLVLGRLLSGFYWTAREWMGTENLSYAWYDHPGMMADMMEFWADFLIEAVRPAVEASAFDYVKFGEDLAMKTGPLLSPDMYRRFIYPNLKRVITFLKSHGVRYAVIDSDGNFESLLGMMLDAGVDATWPLERAADMDPHRIRRQFGRALRLWGAVDKRELARDTAAIDRHLATLAPLVEQGGFIPTVDHTVPPDVSWSNFQHYMAQKQRLIEGRL